MQPELIFFIDRSLGHRKLAQALVELGFEIRLQIEHFPDDTPDPVLLTEVGKRGWLFVTMDGLIRYHDAEKEALVSANLGVFVVATARSSADGMVELFRRHAARIRHLAANQPRPFLAVLTLHDVRLHRLR